MRNGRVLRLGLVVAIAAPVLLFAAYFQVTRWLLSGPKLREIINAHPKSFRIDWDEAVSPFPGRVRLRNLRLRGSDPNVEWAVDLSQAELDYSVLALLRRTFRCTRLVGSGLAFALRTKLDPKELRSADVAVLPPIPGYSDPPLKSPDEKFGLEPNPWRVDVSRIAIDRFESIWLNQFHYRGPARVQGGFFLRPTQLAKIDGALLRFDGGFVTVGRAPDRVSLTGSLSTTSLPFEPIEAPMPRAFKLFATKLDIEVATEDLHAIQEYIRFPEGVRFEGNGPRARVALSMQDGVANGRVDLAIRAGAARTRTYRLTGDLDAELPVRKWNVLAPISVDVSGARAVFAHVHASGTEEAREWWGNFDVPEGKLGSSAAARVQARCRDARPLLALLNVDLPGWTKGLLKLDDFRAHADVSAAPGTIRVRDLEASGGNFQVQGQFDHDGRSDDGAFLIESGILIVGVEVRPNGTKLRPLFAKQWYARVLREGAA